MKSPSNSSSEKENVEQTYEPITNGKYAILMETNGKECESWYYFIRHEGNEVALENLQKQLEKVKDWYIIDDLSTFDLELKHLVDAKTAKDMTKIDLNSYAFHRKFDGRLDNINFNFTKKDYKDNERMICKIFDQLSYGQIEDYISDEDLDSEDLTDSEQSTNTDNDSGSNEADNLESDNSENYTSFNISGLPSSLVIKEDPTL